ncbi:hypothetical protein PGT21_010127 [Puccinia graminis f. sp. tritici]|uniref:Uncharacterized protein n=1 Tax=Puccinia graminis f. sp. tritici TaxID=56615 RepID=A0A5B0Q2G6_PUCGR|nr:hypothetical protein PGT21_010127 [Puccinia graminis f. sp. tritici]KAA1124906.1 hypothetical protein PGTUg99_036546 [Puccinia graminis f. sp. tritici]
MDLCCLRPLQETWKLLEVVCVYLDELVKAPGTAPRDQFKDPSPEGPSNTEKQKAKLLAASKARIATAKANAEARKLQGNPAASKPSPPPKTKASPLSSKAMSTPLPSSSKLGETAKEGVKAKVDMTWPPKHQREAPSSASPRVFIPTGYETHLRLLRLDSLTTYSTLIV